MPFLMCFSLTWYNNTLAATCWCNSSNNNKWCAINKAPWLACRLWTTLKKNYGTRVIKLDIAPKTYPLGQHLFISASNNMFYRHSHWDKRHTICVVNLMPQDTKIVFLNSSYLGSNLQPSGRVSDALPMCHTCLVHLFRNWIYLELNIFLAFILPTSFPISRADTEDISTRAIQVL
jgi:hypothetical protein